MSWQAGAGAEHTPFRHWFVASQHGTVLEQVSPRLPQVVPPPDVDWHVPLVAPAGMAQAVPAQQSAFAVQTPPEATHGVAHTPPLHVPEQHCAPLVHEAPVAVHAVVPPQVPLTHDPWQQSPFAAHAYPAA